MSLYRETITFIHHVDLESPDLLDEIIINVLEATIIIQAVRTALDHDGVVEDPAPATTGIQPGFFEADRLQLLQEQVDRLLS